MGLFSPYKPLPAEYSCFKKLYRQRVVKFGKQEEVGKENELICSSHACFSLCSITFLSQLEE